LREEAKTAGTRGEAALQRMTLGTAILLMIQIAVGMVVNLYAAVPIDHSGAKPANYFGGSLHSVIWAIGRGTLALAIHASLGLALVVMAIWVAVRTVALRPRWVRLTSILGALLVIGAGFNGASFLDFNDNVSSLLMALLALGALSCYVVGLYLLPGSR
jgi:hypothetical protein